MPECATIPLRILNDNRLSRADLRLYGWVSAKADGENRCSRHRVEKVVSIRQLSKRVGKLVRFGYFTVQKDETGVSYLITKESDVVEEPEIRLSTFAKEYETYSRSVHTRKTVDTYQTAFRELIRIAGDPPMKSISIREIEQFLSFKKVEASEWTARKYYTALSSAFEKAVQWKYVKANPFREIPKPKVREVLPAYFTESDFRLFLSAVNDGDFAELCTTAILSGMRLGELINLRWRDLDFAAKTILIQNHEDFTTKSKRSRVVPLSEELLKLLVDRRNNIRSESELVFPNKFGRRLSETVVGRKFKVAVRAAGLNDRLHFHSLRHSFASALVVSGVSLYAVAKLLGHSQSKTSEIYSHLLPGQLHNEVNTLALKFKIEQKCA